MRSKAIFFSLVIILVVSTVWWVWTDVIKNGSQIRERRQELAQLDKKFKKLTMVDESFSEIQDRYGEELNKFDSLKYSIPNRDTFVKVFEEIRRIAKKQNVSIKSLSPNLEDSYPAIKHKLKFTRKYIERYPVQLEVQGDYLTIGAFLEELLTMPTIVNIGRISMDTELDTAGVLSCELVLYAYMFFDKENQKT